MTVEIRELVIKTTVGEAKPTETQSSGVAGQKINQGLVNTCVAEVLNVLRREKER